MTMSGSGRYDDQGPDVVIALNAKLSGPGAAATTKLKFKTNRRGGTGVRWSAELGQPC
jgi:hypothetical protein